MRVAEVARAARRSGRKDGNPLRRVFTWLADCAERSRQRRVLARLEDHSLRDLGLSRGDVEREITKPFWRL